MIFGALGGQAIGMAQQWLLKCPKTSFSADIMPDAAQRGPMAPAEH